MAAQNEINPGEYRRSEDQKNTQAIRALLSELPPFCARFFVALEPNTTTLTRLNYAHDLRLFFWYLLKHTDQFSSYTSVRDFVAADLEKINAYTIEEFLSFLTYYQAEDGTMRDNDLSGKERKLSSIRSMYRYFLKREIIQTNPAALVDTPKQLEKPIIRLEPNEVVRVLEAVESGAGLSEREKLYHKKTKTRDAALLILLLGTGIRVSECVGLNISDFDFDDYSFKVTRKGGFSVILYFNDEIAKPLQAYLQERLQIKAAPGHENALFLSMQNKRLDVRSVQNLVKKYAGVAVPLKKITPHKLRSTFGTQLYRETGDIYLVADVLGHSDVNTTRRHYAAQNEDNRRLAAQHVFLHQDADDPLSE